MPYACKNGRCCATPRWMRWVLLTAGFYHLLFAAWANLWPHLWFDWLGIERPNHPLMWQGLGLMMGLLGLALVFAANNPIRHWRIILVGFVKCSLGLAAFATEVLQGGIPVGSLWMIGLDDLLWIGPFAAILWASVRAHTGVPPTRSQPFSVAEASETYGLSSGITLAEASRQNLLVLVFLRHFGCTFTRQILRELQNIQQEAKHHGAELVLVHMLESGRETPYVGEQRGVTRIADPRCELYRAFGLGKGGFLELFGPHVWWRGAIALFKGCGVGHLAGDGLQMPGAFLFRNGEILSSQRARSAADLPNLPGLFQGLPSPTAHERVTA